MIPTNWIKGNSIASYFLRQVEKDKDGEIILRKLYKCASIRGNNLSVFWIDVCNREMSMALKLCIDCPCNILEEACSKYDGSGKELVKKYLEETKV